MSLSEAERYLEGLINLERDPDARHRRVDLGPVRALLDRVGNPHRALSVLHIAGSKGKGSTALFAESLLRAAGLRVGTFTSPHLVRWTERFRIDGDDVPGRELVAALDLLRPHIDALRAQGDEVPTFFDATTALAFLLFERAKVSWAVIEVGLGGRLDSTNVVAPRQTCITSIELEHTDRLGDTLEQIAGEKAGILKPGVPVCVGVLPDEAAAVIVARAREVGAEIARFGEAFGAAVGELWDGALRIPWDAGTRGAHQGINASLALACVRRMVPDAPWESLAAKALAETELPGRLEVVGLEPTRIVDSAHTPNSARALATELRRWPRRRLHLVLSVSSGKDLAGICEALVPLADALTLTRAEPRRSLAAEEVAEAARRVAPRCLARVVPNPQLALRAARSAAGPEDLLCATGSVYLAGIARRILADASERPVAVSRRSDGPGAATRGSEGPAAARPGHAPEKEKAPGSGSSHNVRGEG